MKYATTREGKPKFKIIQNMHNWAGWPGAYCTKCGAIDLMEVAIANGLFDVYADDFEDAWDDGVNPEDYDNGWCPVEDDDAS